MDWSHVRLYQQWISQEKYEVHKYYVPNRIDNRIKFLRKYFRVMDRMPVPYQYKRRRNAVEYLETALMILGRIDSLCTSDIPFIAGSGYLSPTPWAAFGEMPELKIGPGGVRLVFRDLEDIANYYKPLIIKGGSNSSLFSFRLCPSLSWSLGNKYNLTPHFVISVALCLLYDILLNCGPDCEELYDLFNNDIRVTTEDVDFNEWQDLRCKVMGKHGRIRNKRWPIRIGQFYLPRVPLISTLKFDEVKNTDNLAEGEKVKIFTMTQPRVDPCLGGKCDDDIDSPETDFAYHQRVSRAHEKVNHLGIIGPSWCV